MLRQSLNAGISRSGTLFFVSAAASESARGLGAPSLILSSSRVALPLRCAFRGILADRAFSFLIEAKRSIAGVVPRPLRTEMLLRVHGHPLAGMVASPIVASVVSALVVVHLGPDVRWRREMLEAESLAAASHVHLFLRVIVRPLTRRVAGSTWPRNHLLVWRVAVWRPLASCTVVEGHMMVRIKVGPEVMLVGR